VQSIINLNRSTFLVWTMLSSVAVGPCIDGTNVKRKIG